MSDIDVLLLPAGSAGDVNPFAGLARALLARGHRVTVATNDHFRGLFEDTAASFVALGGAEVFEAVVRRPELWARGPRGVRLLMSASAPFLEPQIELVREHARKPGAVVAAGVLAHGARVARELSRFPLATVQLAPIGLPSDEQPPRLPGSPIRPWMPLWLKRAGMRVADRVADSMCAELAALRRRLGLPETRGLLTRWVNSPDAVLALFPSWFAPPPPDWPANTRLLGFPLWDHAGAGLDTPVREFLAACGETRPLVFAPGSANAQAPAFFRAAVEACARLARPGILLTPYAEQVPASLPARVACFDYVPLSALLPRAAALASHGGIGTVSQALAAGIPQLAMPLAFDQADNHARLRRLGVTGAALPRRPGGPGMARALAGLLDDPRVADATARCARRLRGDGDTLSRACEAIEFLGTRFETSPGARPATTGKATTSMLRPP